MLFLDNILEKRGLKYEKLTPDEKETFSAWQEALSKSQVTLDSVREYIKTMRDAVEDRLAFAKFNSDEDKHLKARLQNYMLLAAMLSTPEKARKAIERQAAGIITKK